MDTLQSERDPVMAVTQGERSASPASAKSGADLLRVLLVDDHGPVLRFLASAFTAQGCLVSTASTAEKALDLLSDHPFDLVVSDIKMPGLSGLDLLRTVKGKQPGTPVVLITGAPSDNYAVFGLRLGAYDYLPKPFSVKEVQELIQRLRKDRQQRHGQLGLPAGLMEELSRRQFGVEVLFRIGELALQGLEPGVLADTVLDFTIRSLRSDAGLILLRDEDGNFAPSQKGQPELIHQLLGLLNASFEKLIQTGGRETLTLTGKEHSFAALAALIPGVGKAMGILCLGRASQRGAFLPDEKELLLGYARTTALALQKILLRENLERNLIDTIASFVVALESKDIYLKGHSARVALYAGEIATTMGLSPAQVLVTRRAAMLHDLGKLVVVDSVLQKPDRLTRDEYALMKRHPLIADKILRPLRFLAQEATAVKHHHERYDGKGYPDGLKGEEIPLLARIVTVADSFDAMTSTRPYRSALPVEVAIGEILRGASAQFDPKVTEAFTSIPRGRLTEISRHFDMRAGAIVEPSSPAAAAAGPAIPQPLLEAKC
jgi:response regulator RpfG family c-di-GMP phosphodiesterase